jgi:FxsC-like protein
MSKFFFSYARQDTDAHLERFYRDLDAEIRSRLGMPIGEGTPEAGFRDVSEIQTGDPWPQVILQALQASQVMVSVLSPGYFTREHCGKEWQFFRERQELYLKGQPANTLAPPVILPVLWVPFDKLPRGLPDVVKNVQYRHDSYGQTYADEGLKYLMRLGPRYEEEYQKFLTRFAKDVINAAQIQLPALDAPPQLNAMHSAFLEPDSKEFASSDVDANIGADYARLVFVAGKPTELKPIRQVLDSYGKVGGQEWQPFMPSIARRVGAVAQEVAAAQEMFTSILPLDHTLMQQLQAAEKNNEVVVLVVDPWTVKLPHYQAPMNDYDQRNLINCVVLVPWNPNDPAMVNQRAQLELFLRQAFPRKTTVKDPNCFIDNIASLEDFKKVLAEVLTKARARVMQLRQVMRPPPPDEFFGKPIITGPGGTGGG